MLSNNMYMTKIGLIQVVCGTEVTLLMKRTELKLIRYIMWLFS